MSANSLINVPTIPLVDIDVTDRIREDLGDIEGLMRSIQHEGLLQPIVVEQVPSNGKPYRLLAGGRRFTAFTELSKQLAGFDRIPYVLISELTALQRIRLEVEENLRRKEMTWQEITTGIARYHAASVKAAKAERQLWTQESTGELLGFSQASVSIAIRVARELSDPQVAGAASMMDALKVILAKEQDVAQARLAQLIAAKKSTVAPSLVPTGPLITGSGITQPGQAPKPVVSSATSFDINELIAASKTAPKLTLQDIAGFYRKGDCLNVLPQLVGAGVQHIITDPPYGIDMDNVSNSERVAETHDVAENLQLLPEFLRLAYDVVAENGFLCMWYDLDHHEKLAHWAKQIGWRVCRWPVVWCKTSPCLNQAASYNVTKATEVCYIMRRSEHSIIKKKQPLNYILAPSAANAAHPFTKPASVWDYLIQTVSEPGQVCLDPFAGMGSALAAFYNAGRVPLGIECDDKHINGGLLYIQELTSNNDELLSSPAL